MIVRPVTYQERAAFDAVVNHPIQSWTWGEFRVATGLQVIRLGLFDEGRIVQGATLTVHPLPIAIPGLKGKSILYYPRGVLPNSLLMTSIKQHAEIQGAVYVKMEPDYAVPVEQGFGEEPALVEFMQTSGLRYGREMFTKYNFWLDLTKTEEELMAQMEQKTRYNTRLAMKKGVTVEIDNSGEAFEKYLQLTQETTQRQGFYAHSRKYQEQMWQYMHGAGIANLLCARYQGEILSTWVLFTWKDKLYYPYGASTRANRDVMANNLMMWEAIRFGKSRGLRLFDMWGTAGANPSPEDAWYGFHKFKQGYGPQLMEYVGTFDFVTDSSLYWVVQKADEARRSLLKWKARLGGGGLG